MSDVSSVQKFFATANEGFNTTTSGIVASGGTIIGLNNVTGLVNGSVFVGIIEPGLTNQQVFTGTVDTTGSQITGVTWLRGVNVQHSSGVRVVDYVTGGAFNMLSAGIQKQHKQSGAHSNITADSISNAGGYSQAGGTFNVPAGSILGTAISNLPYAGLLSTIFSGQLQTWGTNGSYQYANIGGIKIMFGTTQGVAVGANNSTTQTMTLPTNFFTNVPTAVVTLTPVGNSQQYAVVGARTTGGVDVIFNNNSSTTQTLTAQFIAIGT